jgi:hypothetical protein
MNLFQTYQLRQTIKNNTNFVHSFLSIVEMNPPLYYVMNYNQKNILVYNETWDYQTTFTLNNNSFYPSYSININGTIYISGSSGIHKYDKYINLTKTVRFLVSYRGIYYNPSNQLIYSTILGSNVIKIFDQDLNLNSTINTSQNPWFLTGYNDKLVVGDLYDGKVYFYQNNSMIQSISTQCTARVSSVLFDSYNHMLVLCETSSKAFIYHLNGSFTGINFYTCKQPTFFNFDSKHRLVIICAFQIDIYY